MLKSDAGQCYGYLFVLWIVLMKVPQVTEVES